MRILIDELRLRRVSLLVWTGSVVLVVAMVALLYPSIGRNSGYDQIMQSMPPELQALFGGTSMGTPEGYLSIELYSVFLPAVLLAYAIGRGAACVAGEEEAHTLDLLLAQPVSRTSVYLQKATAVTIGVLVLSAASLVTLVALRGPSGMDGLAVGPLVAVTVLQGLMALAFGMLALAVAVATGSRTAGMAVAGGYAFLGYLIEGLGQSVSWLDRLRPASPWHWYSAGEPLLHGITWTDAGVLAVAAVVVAGLGLLAFGRRDLRA